MEWLPWALLSAIFAGVTAVLVKVGVQDIDSNLAQRYHKAETLY